MDGSRSSYSEDVLILEINIVEDSHRPRAGEESEHIFKGRWSRRISLSESTIMES